MDTNTLCTNIYHLKIYSCTQMTKTRQCFTIVVVVFVYPLFFCLPFSCLPSLIFTLKSLSPNFSVWYRSRDVWMGEGLSHWFDFGVLGFVRVVTGARNLTPQPDSRFPIPDTSPVPCPTREWGVELRGSYVSKMLQPQFRFDRLSTHVCGKGIFPFSLPWLNSITWLQPRLPYLVLHPLN